MDTQGLEERRVAAAEKTATNTDLLVLIAQLWSFAGVLGIVVGLVVWVKSTV